MVYIHGSIATPTRDGVWRLPKLGARLRTGQKAKNIRTETVELAKVNREGLVSALQGVDVVVSALNGRALKVQSTI